MRYLLLALVVLASCAFALTHSEAREIAAGNPACTSVGPINATGYYNANSRTWWFDIHANRTGCAPACVVSENRTAEVNWRCTGLA